MPQIAVFASDYGGANPRRAAGASAGIGLDGIVDNIHRERFHHLVFLGVDNQQAILLMHGKHLAIGKNHRAGLSEI